MRMPKIEIDQDRCTEPYECKICLQTCPQAVFTVAPTRAEKFKETEPDGYKVLATYRDKCVTCMDCVKACPNNAITVKVSD